MSRWLLPVGIVLLVSVALAAVHFYFTRFITRMSQSDREEPPDDDISPPDNMAKRTTVREPTLEECCR